MNKHLHRIVFNAVRGMRMVVQETARSAGKASGATSAVLATALLTTLPAPAQIVGAPGVAPGLRPTVLLAPNGVPLVNVQTPSAAGVSRNLYHQFDVQPRGVILNNSRTDVQTQLGGWVQANPWLANGPARIILNEVTSGNPTQLRGAIEVGGQRAEVIVANPAGIAVDGATFINASRATLTTGTPQLDAFGGLEGYVVRGGTVSIDGAGLDARSTDYAAILARAIKVNAALWANELQVVTGANQVSADQGQISPTTGTGKAPVFALDVAHLGGMYAGKITLIGTEHGVGARNAGTIMAADGSGPLSGPGEFVITADGRLENIGTIQAARRAAIAAESLANSGRITSGGELKIATPGPLANAGTLDAQSLQLASASDIDNRGGTMRQTSGVGLTIKSPVLSNTAGGVIGAEPVPEAPAQPGTGTGIDGTGASGPTTPSTGAGTDSSGGSSGATTASPGDVPAPGAITAAGSMLNDGGRIHAGGATQLDTPQVNNNGGSITTTNLAASGPSFSNAGGTVNVSQGFSAHVDRFDNTGGTLRAGSLQVASTGDLVNTEGQLESSGDANIAAGGSLDNTRGSITAARHVAITAASMQGAGVLAAGTQADGKLGATGDLRVTTTGALAANGTILAAGDATLQGASVDLSSATTSATNIALTATHGNVITSRATITTPGNLSVTASSHGAHPGGTLVASAGHDVNLVGAIVANQGPGGLTSISAKNDVNLGTVRESRTVMGVGIDNSSAMVASSSREQGTTIATDGTTRLNAGRDVHARQATVHAGTGLLSVQAGRDIHIESGQAQTSGSFSMQWTDKGLVSRTANTLSGQNDSSTRVGSRFDGGLVALGAKNDISIEGSHISGTQGVMLDAGRLLHIVEGRNTSSASADFDRKRSSPIKDPVFMQNRAAGTGIDVRSNTAAASTLTSSQGGVLLRGGAVNLQGVEVSAARDIAIEGGTVNIAGAIDRSQVGGEQRRRGGDFGALGLHDLGHGLGAKSTDTLDAETTTLARTTLGGANVSISATGADGQGGDLHIAGTTIDTPGTLSLNAGTLSLDTQSTVATLETGNQRKDFSWQQQGSRGTSDETPHYNQFNAATLAVNAHRVQAGLGARDSLDQLARQPGMSWIEQLDNDPDLSGKVDWARVEEAHRNWDYQQQGLTPEGAAIVTLAVAYFTAGAASGLGGAAASATGSTMVGGAVQVGVTTLASQASVALINNRGDIGAALNDLGSSASVKSLLTAIVTGGVLAGLNLDPTGLPTTGGGAQPFMTQLRQNLTAGAARAVIGTAINGGSFEENLREGLKTALLDTAAAQTAFAIGSAQLDDFTNKIAHSIAGCVVGAVRADSASGCGAGALGAAIGEMAAEAYGWHADTPQFAALMSGVAAAVVGMDAADIHQAGQAGSNAAVNNYGAHLNPFRAVKEIAGEEKRRLEKACGADCTKVDFDRIDAQVAKVEAIATLIEVSRRTTLTGEQALRMGELVASLLPIYGTPIGLYQAISGKSLTGEDLGTAERFFTGVVAAVPIGSATYRLINSAMADFRLAASFGGLGPDGKALMDFSRLSSHQKGVVGELLGANTVQNVLPGATRLGRTGEIGSQGIDDLYKVTSANADYVIVEYKFGTSKLNVTADGLQMSDGWVLGGDRLANASGSRAEAKAVADAMALGRVEKWVVHVDPAGGASIWIVDAFGKFVRATSDVESKVLGASK